MAYKRHKKDVDNEYRENKKGERVKRSTLLEKRRLPKEITLMMKAKKENLTKPKKKK